MLICVDFCDGFLYDVGENLDKDGILSDDGGDLYDNEAGFEGEGDGVGFGFGGHFLVSGDGDSTT